MRIGSLFSGYGGLEMGVSRVFPDAHPAWFVEYDEAPSKILAHHYPGVPNYGDVTKCDWETMPPIDILTGGYPCQPFSRAGRRKGTDDERHLWPYVREAIRRIRPRFTLLENVAGHRSLGFDTVLADLAEDGLHARWCSLRVSDIGGAHHRERLFILVTDPEGVGWGARQHCADVGQADREVHPFGNDCLFITHPHGIRMEAGEQSLSSAQEVSGADNRERPFPNAHRVGRDRRGTTPLEEGRAHQPTDRHSSINWGHYAPAIRRWERVTGTPAPAPTELNSKGNPRLNAAFAEWLMGLPDGWVTQVPGITRAQQLKALGNGVVPQQAAAALTQLLTP